MTSPGTWYNSKMKIEKMPSCKNASKKLCISKKWLLLHSLLLLFPFRKVFRVDNFKKFAHDIRLYMNEHQICTDKTDEL